MRSFIILALLVERILMREKLIFRVEKTGFNLVIWRERGGQLSSR